MCPGCGKPLIIFELGGVEIDRCLSCGGTWLDAGEIELLTRLEGVAAGRLTEALRSRSRGEKGDRRCVRCGRWLETILVEGSAAEGEARAESPAGTGTPIELDRCPRGHGFWLDRGELDAVAAAFTTGGALMEGEGGTVARFLTELSRHDKAPREEDGTRKVTESNGESRQGVS